MLPRAVDAPFIHTVATPFTMMNLIVVGAVVIAVLFSVSSSTGGLSEEFTLTF